MRTHHGIYEIVSVTKVQVLKVWFEMIFYLLAIDYTGRFSPIFISKLKLLIFSKQAEKPLMNNECIQFQCTRKFQGFLTMRTPSILIQALCFIILFVELVLTKRPPCEAGRWQYSEGKGRCVRCRCPKGTQLSGSQVGQP